MIDKSSRFLRLPMAPMLERIDPKILSFGIVGAIGFVIDALLLTLLSTKFGLDILSSRAVSFTCATLVTWFLNRTFTFSQQTSYKPQACKKEYFLYLAVQAIGAALNLATFLALIEFNPELRQIPVLPLACGAIVALLFNFTMSRKFVFVNRDGTNE